MSLGTLAPGGLFITPFAPALVSEHSCLSPHFYGNYRDGSILQSVFRGASGTCIESFFDSVASAHFTAVRGSAKHLVWVDKASISHELAAQYTDDLDEFILRLQSQSASAIARDSASQVVMQDNSPVQLYHRSSTSALLSVTQDQLPTLDTSLPPFWRSTVIPESPVTYIPVPEEATERVKTILNNLKFDPKVEAVVQNISLPQIHKDIRWLTGESGSGIVSRHSFSTGAVKAAQWLKAQVEETGASCRLVNFLVGFAPNVICRYDGINPTNATVLVSGHYDSRGSFGSTRAPGGDDDGSGTTGVLSIARTIGRKNIKFHANVELAFFAGEEQGLLGSRAYARELRANDADIILMVQADMTAYRAPGEPRQLGLPDLIGSPEVTKLVSDISALYSPELEVGTTSACCSDHQSFHEQGFPATQVFERAGPIADPFYHNSGDVSDREGYDFEQLLAIARVQFATVLHAAGFDLPHRHAEDN